MAKLVPEFCAVAFEIRSALEEGRNADAKRIAVEHLRAGYHSQPFLNINLRVRSRQATHPAWRLCTYRRQNQNAAIAAA
jgi:hypothetical protein